MECSICKKKFGGATAQTRLNSHTKAAHLDFYRETIRPLKDTKAVNRDSYLRQKEKDPEKVKKARVMSRMRQKARQRQIDRIERATLPSRPYLPTSPEIDPLNPYYIVEYKLRIFIGVTKAELLDFPLEATLRNHLDSIGAKGADDDVATMIRDAMLRLEDLPSLATRYQCYKKVLQTIGDYPEALALFEKRYLTQEHKQLMPESYVDEELVQADAEKLYQLYLKGFSRRQQFQKGQKDTDTELGLDLDLDLAAEDLGAEDHTEKQVQSND